MVSNCLPPKASVTVPARKTRLKESMLKKISGTVFRQILGLSLESSSVTLNIFCRSSSKAKKRLNSVLPSTRVMGPHPALPLKFLVLSDIRSCRSMIPLMALFPAAVPNLGKTHWKIPGSLSRITGWISPSVLMVMPIGSCLWIKRDLSALPNR